MTNEVWLRLEDDTTQLAPVSLLLDELSQLVFVMRETVVAVEVILPLEASVLTQSTVELAHRLRQRLLPLPVSLGLGVEVLVDSALGERF